MQIKPLRWLLPFILLGGAYAGYATITASASEGSGTKPEKKPLMVTVSTVRSSDHKVLITSYGELVPAEVTQLSAQVSGEVVSWHPNFVVGGVVKRGETLFSIERDNYQAAVLQAEANLASAQAALIEEKAKAEVAKRQAKNLPAKQVTELYLRKPQVLSAQAQVKSAQAALKRANRDLEHCNVVAPYDALVVSRDIGVGQYISAGAHVATLNNVEAAEIHIPIAGFDSAFLPKNYAGIAANVIQRGIVDIQREGVIARDLGVVDSATRMINMVVRVDDPYAIESNASPLKFGSYVEVQFVGKELKHIYRLPQELVNNRQVWVVNENNELEPRLVNVLRAEQEFMLINEGLTDEDKIVLTVPEYPQQGMRVEVAATQTDLNL
ncbi:MULTISPECIES: efflux RND transporter periplasmic adaptor subunit [Vibrio]|uniref:efflux RND transporter periplasmic adaptor subunit n=1 Tax=Vibrio TaxID=662 RepID=UPI002075E038|nr:MULTISPECIES: efflux RND transporter periplasmic adaptor subunit [Vibrio]USD35004.1 efflux RND transporter periplasmic adaptor subunit [Vibrio sp. SCSIO 43186]USD48070.1 efflux RND transporter periplasmic adaptor subunit [Vibrio sp. SCSIO 43145]USD72129.1 efflux RND transporter periplasmic adaptor subunit [Vibrio sp. SCSIO 43139]USD97800.1 efflux transporter periplasmic adaptor subunit [Vibrio coralliilyticus]